MATTKQLPRIKSEPRQRTGTRYARRLRTDGKLPGVVYGHGKGNVPIVVDAEAFNDILQEHSHLVEVELDGAAEPCLIKDVQWDHLSSRIIHVDLTRVDLSEEVEVDVEIELVGEPASLEEEGAVLSQPLTELTITCRADSIPENITVDIGELGVGDSITVGELTLPEGVKAVTDEDQMVVQISVVAEAPEEEEAPVEGAEEPEVIGKAEAAEGEAGESEEKQK